MKAKEAKDETGSNGGEETIIHDDRHVKGERVVVV